MAPKVALVHERSMLGGNSSSEVRLYPEVSTNHNIWSKEAGILEELHVEERVRNHEPYSEGLMNSVWDLVLYEWVVREPNITLFLNTTVREVEMRDPQTILCVHGYQLGTEKKVIVSAPIFVDSTGDGVLGYRAGADFRWGMEARSEFNEDAAPESPAAQPQMGNSLFFRARDAGRPVPFRAPSWAASFDTEQDLAGRNHSNFDHGYWWIEVGLPMHQIHDNEKIRHEALRQLLGVWDHIKNRCTNREKARNYGLDFVSFWPYKREARRLVGDYVLKQSDVQRPPQHEDAIAFGCWYVDVHKPGGILARAKPNTKPTWEEAGTVPLWHPAAELLLPQRDQPADGREADQHELCSLFLDPRAADGSHCRAWRRRGRRAVPEIPVPAAGGRPAAFEGAASDAAAGGRLSARGGERRSGRSGQGSGCHRFERFGVDLPAGQGLLAVGPAAGAVVSGDYRPIGLGGALPARVRGREAGPAGGEYRL